MIVDEVRHECLGDVCELSGHVQSEAWANEEFRLWYRVPADLAPEHTADNPDCSPFVAGLLLWCLRRGEPLRIEGSASGQLLANVPLIADVCKAFWPGDMSMVEVSVDAREPPRGNELAASFFTRGVDSWYTALTHGQRSYDGAPLTHLVYVPSVDFMFDEPHLQRCIADTCSAAAAIGKTPVLVETNLRRNTEHFLHWGIYAGAGLASAALALGVEQVHIPASRSYAYQAPEGTHLFLDPLWSSSRTEIVHHGAEASRWDKVVHLANAPDALRTLKICFDENTDGNCGRCPKCLVTMVMLEAVRVLDQCPFDRPLDPSRVARLELASPLLELMRDAVLPNITDRRLAVALRIAVLRPVTRDVMTQGGTALRALGSALVKDPETVRGVFRRPAQR